MDTKTKISLILVLAAVLLGVLWMLRPDEEITDRGESHEREPSEGAPHERAIADTEAAAATDGSGSTPVVAREVSRPAEQPPLDLVLEIDTVAQPRGASLEWHSFPRPAPAEECIDVEFRFEDLTGSPLPGKLTFLAGPSEGASFSVGKTGVARVCGLIPGRHVARVDSGLHSVDSHVRYLRLEAGTTFVIRCGGVSSVSGSVSDEQHRPIVGARVASGRREAVTNIDGHYEIRGLSAGEGVPLRVMAEGFATVEVPVHLRPDVGLRHHFVLSRGARVKGRVVLPPRVKATPELFLLPAHPGRAPPHSDFPYHVTGLYKVAEDGTFVVDGLPAPVEVLAIARHPRIHMTRPVAFYVRTPGLQRNELILTTKPASLVAGTVLGARGSPLLQALVTCRPERENWKELRESFFLTEDLLALHVVRAGILMAETTWGYTDENGEFSFARSFEQNSATLSAEAFGHASQSKRIDGPGDLVTFFHLRPEGKERGSRVEQSSLRFSFLPAVASQPLRIKVLREGIKDAKLFPWDSSRPYAVRLGSDARVRVRGTFEDQGRVLSRFEKEVVMRGDAAESIILPAR